MSTVYIVNQINCYHLIMKKWFTWLWLNKMNHFSAQTLVRQLWNSFFHPKMYIATQSSIVFVKSADQNEITSFNNSVYDLVFNIFAWDMSSYVRNIIFLLQHRKKYENCLYSPRLAVLIQFKNINKVKFFQDTTYI